MKNFDLFLRILAFVVIFLGILHCLKAENAYSLAFQAFNAGQWDEAFKQIENEIKSNPNSSPAWELKGRVLLGKKQFSDAEQALRKALELAPQASTPHFYLGNAFFEQRFWGEAMDCYVVFAKKSTEPRDAILKIIYCEIASGELAEATKHLSNLDPFDKDHPGYYFAHAALDRAKGDADKAEASLKQVQTLYGNTAFNRYFPDYVWIFKKGKN